MTDVAKLTGDEFIKNQVGMVTEVLTHYGPVNRFWFDGTASVPKGTDLKRLWNEVYSTIRRLSPSTLISPYRGDICASIGTVYTNDGPPPNSTDTSGCAKPVEGGKYFHPTEMHGITMQEGPDGNADAMPTYWFWHPWACAKNVSGCPWEGHANASRIFDSYLATVGHGAVLNMNIPPERTGRMNASVAEVMRVAGKALNDTFGTSVASLPSTSAPCSSAHTDIVLDVPRGETFDYVVTMEDLAQGQRIANYSIEFQRRGSSTWSVLVPPVWKTNKTGVQLDDTFGDRPDGHDPRDSHIGYKRIDVPLPTAAKVDIARIRFVCLRSLEDPIHIAALRLHRKRVPW